MEEQRTVFQKAVLMILAAMIVVFGVVTAYCQTIEGIRFRDSFLRKVGVSDADGFSGKVEGENVTILRWRQGWDDNDPNTTGIMLQVGGRKFDHYSVYLGEPMIRPQGPVSGSAPPLWDDIQTLRIAKNGEVIYEGGYREESGLFFTSDGEWSGLNVSMSTRVVGADPWENYTPSKSFLVQLALGPELVDRGDWRLYGLAVFLTIVMMADVAFPYTLFRWRHRRWVKDPEPTDDYMSMQHLSWVICPILLLVFYIFAATTTMAVV